MKVIIYKDSLQFKYPEVASEWCIKKNNGLLPINVTPGSNKKVWWVCSRGHEYLAMVSKRAIRGQGCPYCANVKVLVGYNDLATTHPNLLPFWDYEKNSRESIMPEKVLSGTDKKAWWICEHGHSYQMRIANKAGGAGCPVCSSQILTKDNCLATTNPDLAQEWHPSKNGSLTPHDVMSGSHKKVWWQCKYGHEWQAQPYSRLVHGCPVCDSEKRTSFPEQAISFYLGKLFEVVSRENIGGFEADIYCPSLKVAIEYDGEYYHSSTESNNREERKNIFFIENGILLFRVKETKTKIPFDCHQTAYGYDLCTTYSQDYIFIKEVVGAILRVINHRFKTNYSININIVRDQVAIIERFAQQKGNNSFLKQKPLGARKWNYEKNGDIDLSTLPKTSKKKYWWKCPTCGNEWFGSLDNVVNSLTCNKCSRQIKTEYDVAPETQMGPSAVFRELPDNLQNENPDLASQWHPSKNGYFKPIHVSPKSGKRVWWLCPKCGNEWVQIIKTRNNGKTARMCPVCAKNQKVKSSDSLDEFNHILYTEWHRTNNGNKLLTDYTPGSGVKAWWKCSKCGTDFICPIKKRKNGGGCPTCARKSTTLSLQKRVKNRSTNEIFDSIKSAAESCGIHRTAISNCLKGKSKTAAGYEWQYYDSNNS